MSRTGLHRYHQDFHGGPPPDTNLFLPDTTSSSSFSLPPARQSGRGALRRHHGKYRAAWFLRGEGGVMQCLFLASHFGTERSACDAPSSHSNALVAGWLVGWFPRRARAAAGPGGHPFRRREWGGRGRGSFTARRKAPLVAADSE